MSNVEQQASVSLPEVHGTVSVPTRRGFLRRIFAISGPAFLVSVGYMDPGNWATDLAAGSGFEYRLLWVLLLSNLIALLLQGLSARLGIVRGLDLAQACRREYGRAVNFVLYGLCEVAIAACDLAEVLGSAIALQLLFGLPLLWGVLLTAADTFALLFLSQLGIRKLEALILSFITLISGCLFLQVFLAGPHWPGVANGLIPRIEGSSALLVALGMLGATVMPHNLYLHSALVQTRRIGPDETSRRQAIRLNTVDSAVALNMALLVNASILILAAAVFHGAGRSEVTDIREAHALLGGLLGSAWAPVAFAVALLASGQSSTITGTLAGQIVMEGFLSIRIPPWLRRLITRTAAIVPAVIVLAVAGENAIGELLILSQVVLSLQLPFAAIPLIRFVTDRKTMGPLAARGLLRPLGWLAALVIVGLNGWLVWDTLNRWSAQLGPRAAWLRWGVTPLLAAGVVLLGYIAVKPWLEWLFRPRGDGAASVHRLASDPPDLSGAARDYRRVAVALDFSGRERPVLFELVQLLGSRRPRLALLHVVESAGARFLGKDAGDAEVASDEAWLEACAGALRALGFEVECHLGLGRRVPELARMVEEFGADLLVLGLHGHRFVSDLLHGSTADALRHRVSCSVLMVGTGAKA
jgi:manganese transport protein